MEFTYKLIQNQPNSILRLLDGAIIPQGNNGDWQLYQAWLLEGNTPLPADEIPVPVNLNNLITALEPFFTKALEANYVVGTQIFNMLLALRTTQEPVLLSFEYRNLRFNLNIIKDIYTEEEVESINLIFKILDTNFNL
jgi:hypothetical protein